MLNRKINIIDENIKNLWQKDGEFSNSCNYGQLTRTVTYNNLQSDNKITKVQLLGWRNGDTSFHISINRAKYKEVKKTLIENGFPKPEFINKEIYRLNLPNNEYLQSFLKGISMVEPSIKAISQEIIESFSPFSKEQPTIPGWLKKHDFNHKFDSGALLNREVEYNSTNANCKIKKLEIFGYNDGEIVFACRVKKSQLPAFAKFLVKSAYLPPEEFETVYRITVPNIQFLTSFLQSLTTFEPSLNAVTPEIIESVKPYSKEEPTLPGWNKSGSFAETYDSGAKLNRSETYTNIYPDAKIKKLKLLGYFGGKVAINLIVDKRQFDAVIDPLVANGFDKPDFLSKDIGMHIINIANKEALDKFLSIISTSEPTIKNIANKVKQSYIAGTKYNNDNDEALFNLLFSNNDPVGSLRSIGLGFTAELLQLQFIFAALQDSQSVLEENKNTVKINNNTSTLFGHPLLKRKNNEIEKNVSDEDMAHSSFGQSSNTAKRLRH